MDTGVNFTDAINIMAVVTSPLIAVWVSQWLAAKDKKREDKMKLFSTLMSNRMYSWSQEMVVAYNMIDIVFYDEQEVLDRWHGLYNLLNKTHALSADELKEISEAQVKLLETMAKSLGYSKNYNWNFIRTLYIPVGMQQEIKNQELYKQQQLEILAMMLNGQLKK